MALRSTQRKSASCWRLKGIAKLPLPCFLASPDKYEINFSLVERLDICPSFCTNVLFSGLILLVLLPNPEPRMVNIIAILDLLFLSYAFVSYALAFFGKRSKLQDLEP